MPNLLDLEWENQNGLAQYPFLQDAPISNIVVDATFQQFDNFIPTLNYILVSSTSLTVNLTYDTNTSNFTLLQSDYNSGINFIRMFDNTTRYIGRLTFNNGVNNLWSAYVGQKIEFNLPFVATTVRSISSKCGVFSIEGLYGNVSFVNATADSTIFFNTNTNFVTFNAVGNYKLPATPPAQALKLLNLMPPIDNNIFISSSDIIQIAGDGIGALNVNLVGSQPNTVPTKIISTTGF